MRLKFLDLQPEVKFSLLAGAVSLVVAMLHIGTGYVLIAAALILYFAIAAPLFTVLASIREMTQRIHDSSKIEVFSKPEVAWQYIRDNLSAINLILNTSVCDSNHEHIVREAYMAKSAYKDFINALFDAMVAQQLTCAEIIHPVLVGVDEHRFNQFMKTHPYSDFYVPRVYENDIEYVEFSILFYKDKNRPGEVVIGWHYAPKTAFFAMLSSDRKVVEYFHEHWKYLKEHSKPIESYESRKAEGRNVHGTPPSSAAASGLPSPLGSASP